MEDEDEESYEESFMEGIKQLLEEATHDIWKYEDYPDWIQVTEGLSYAKKAGMQFRAEIDYPEYSVICSVILDKGILVISPKHGDRMKESVADPRFSPEAFARRVAEIVKAEKELSREERRVLRESYR